MKKILLLLMSVLLLVGCKSRQQQSHEVASEFDQQKEETALREMVGEVYGMVNERYNGNYDPTDYEGQTLELLYTTKDYQLVYDSLYEIEQRMYDEGHPNDAFFAEGGNVWVMGTHSLPFTTEVVKVVFDDEQHAQVWFILKPVEGEEIDVIWLMEKADDRWRIQDFIEAYEDYEFSYLDHMRDYIKRKQ